MTLMLCVYVYLCSMNLNFFSYPVYQNFPHCLSEISKCTILKWKNSKYIFARSFSSFCRLPTVPGCRFENVV